MTTFRFQPGPALPRQRARIQQARALLRARIPQILATLADDCTRALADAAPRGKEGDQSAPAGDASGPLASSFVPSVEVTGDLTARALVRTTQPTKLTYVRYGTGIYGPEARPIRPRTKKALFWPGADHPVRQVRGQQANDFVSPIIEIFQAEGNDRMDALGIEVAQVLNGVGGGGL